jgi:polyisoprenoid-binding protein YceI
MKTRDSAAVTYWIVLFILLAGTFALSQETNYKDLLGEWDVQTEDGQYSFVFTFSMENETLKGMFRGSTGEVEMEDLSYQNNELKFTVNIEAGGQTMQIDFSATIQGDTLDGYLSLQYGEANITGTKRK